MMVCVHVNNFTVKNNECKYTKFIKNSTYKVKCVLTCQDMGFENDVLTEI